MKTNQDILVSIVIPAYNVKEYIGETLESICKNKLDAVEIIVIDDGSKDTTRDVVEECFERINPPYCKYIYQENAGVSVARNAGIENAEGKYLIFCDGDDLFYPNLIEDITPQLHLKKDLIVWGFDITQNGNRTIGQGDFGVDSIPKKEVFKAFLMGKSRLRLGSFAVKKAFLKETGIQFTVGCPVAEDVEFEFKCLAKVGEIAVINKILFTYAKRDGSVMYTYNLNRFEASRAIKRISSYVKENTDLFMDNEVKDYLRNGLLIQHSMFSFDACIKYLTDKNQRKNFLREYYEKYSDVEQEIERACKEMRILPPVFGKKRVRLFCISRSLYVSVMMFRMGL